MGGRDRADALVSSIKKTYGTIFLYGKSAAPSGGESVLELKQSGW